MHSITPYLERMVALGASDLYLTFESPAAYRVGETLMREGDLLLDDALQKLWSTTFSADQLAEFEKNHEINTAFTHQLSRFRINGFRQQHHLGMVIRHIRSEIPTAKMLGLPIIYEELALQPRGLVLIAGPTGSGKSTSLASMIHYRNQHTQGHIITVEDPVEYTHNHLGCIVTQRDVGLDTASFSSALKNALRQRPDVVAIGEIRDRDVMEQAMYFAETGHLCIATLHASHTPQAIERAINLFPERRQAHVRHHLSVHLLAVMAQRLVPTIKNTRTVAYEVLVNKGLIRSLIEEGKTDQLHDMIAKGSADSMVTMDDTLLGLYRRGLITEDTALAESKNPAQLRMIIRQKILSAELNPKSVPRYTLKKPTD